MNRSSKFRTFALLPLLALAGAGLVAADMPSVFAATHKAAPKQTKKASGKQNTKNATTTGYVYPAITSASATIPSDIQVQGGAANATIYDAAQFAWQEFIALNWPAVIPNGTLNSRTVANSSQNFGSDAQGQPLVWETLRGKVETFPGTGNPPGYVDNAGQDYGYDFNNNPSDPGGPQYIYAASVPPCTGQGPVNQPAWVNLDEVTQIGDDSMFAGLIPSAAANGNSQPQLIRFLAKGNRTFYEYVAANQFWYPSANYKAATANLMNAEVNNQYPPQAPYVNLPSGTILAKAAWRILGPNENAANFHTQTVRYYESNGSGQCYREATWALIALHIIQKTPTAPYFIFATFEYAGNILNQGGTAVEDNNGNVSSGTPSDRTTPAISYFDANTNPNYNFYNYAFPQGTTSVMPPNPLPPAYNNPFPASFPTNDAAYCTVGSATTPMNESRLYYINAQFAPPSLNNLPASGSSTQGICVDRRYFDIPQQIVQVNAAAHQALTNYGAPTRWQNYKLVNVQWQPFNNASIDPTGSNTARQAATYFLSNSVVETNNTLQQFFGEQTDAGTKSGYEQAVAANGNITVDTSTPAFNVYVPPTTQTIQSYTRYNMGGCMGCHGRAERAGDDFSFTLAGGPVTSPESPQAQAAERLVKLRAALSGTKLPQK